MTAFEVYLVMQADSVVVCSIIAALILALASVPVALLASDGQLTWKVPKVLCSLAAVFFLVAMLTPSTKTLAAMYVIPAVTSEHAVEKIAPEVREVWELAKDALREAGKKSEVEK